MNDMDLVSGHKKEDLGLTFGFHTSYRGNQKQSQSRISVQDVPIESIEEDQVRPQLIGPDLI